MARIRGPHDTSCLRRQEEQEEGMPRDVHYADYITPKYNPQVITRPPNGTRSPLIKTMLPLYVLYMFFLMTKCC